MKENQKINFVAGVAMVCTLYAAVRFWNMSASCLVFDEIFSVHAASRSWSALFSFVAADLIHPPLFYLLLKIWILAGGESLYWLRLFPVFFAVLAIAPFLLLCRELKLKNIETLTALILLAANGALIRYSQEVRMYSPLFCFGLFSLWLFVKTIGGTNFNPATDEENQSAAARRRIAADLPLQGALFLANLLLIYTHYFGWLIIGTELLAIIVFKREKIRPFLVSSGMLVLSFLPWLWAIWRAVPTGSELAQNIGWQAKPGLLKLAQFLLTLNEPFYYQQTSLEPTNILLIAVPISLVCGGVIIAKLAGKKDSTFLLVGIFAIVPVVAAFAASWILPLSIWGVRHLIVIFAPAAILLAAALHNLPWRIIKLIAYGLLGLLITIAGIRHFASPTQTFIWCGWQELAANADKQTSEPTTVYVFEDDGAYQLWFALKNNPKFKIVLIDGYADLPKDKAYFLPREFDAVEIADKRIITGDKFWLAFRETAWKADKQVLQDLPARGYKIGQPLEFRAQGIIIFLVAVEKAN